MVILRPTRRLQPLLPITPGSTGESDTALGDWYANRIIVDRQPLVLLVSATSLLPIVVPARDVRSLPRRLPHLVRRRLQALDVPDALIRAEVHAMADVVTRPTTDRSVLGIMVDFAKGAAYFREPGQWDETVLPEVEAWLAKTPCHAGRRLSQTVFPNRKAPELLHAHWGTRLVQ